MKNLIVVILFLSILLSFCDEQEPDDRCLTVTPNSLDDCKIYTVADSYCCFMSYTEGNEDTKLCIKLTKAQYDDRDSFISNLKEDSPVERLELLCDGDSGESNQGNENENNEPELKNFCDVWPNSNDDKLEYCKKMTVAKGNYCCLLSYDLGEDGNGKSCISLTKDEYDDRNKAISKLLIDFPNGKGEILCDGDNSSTFIKLTKSLIGLLLIIL